METTSKRLAALVLIAATSLFAADPSTSPSLASIAKGRDDSSADLAKKLTNPVSDLTIVPVENNFDFRGGPKEDGFRYTLKLQPVIPISLR